MVSTGLSALSPFCGISAIPSRRLRRSAPGSMPIISAPLNPTFPDAVAEGGIVPVIAWPTVDFPEPDSPTSPTSSPGFRLNDTSLAASTAACRDR